MCCDSWGRKELDTTERLIWSVAHVISLISFLWLLDQLFVLSSSWQGFKNIEIKPQKASYNQEKNFNEKNPSFVYALLF